MLLAFLPLVSLFGVVLVHCLLRWGGSGVCLASGSGGGVERVRLFRKTPAHLARQGVPVVQVRSGVWKRLRDPQGSGSGLPGAKFLRVHREAEGHGPGFVRVGIGLRPRDCMSPRLQVLACRVVIRFCLHCSRSGYTHVEYTLRNNHRQQPAPMFILDQG